MIKIIQRKTISDFLRKELFVFLNKSKPYNFCMVKSPALRNFKILKYIELLESYYCYEAWDDSIFLGAAFFSCQNRQVELQFVFGVGGKNLLLKQAFNEVLNCVFQDFSTTQIHAEIHRIYKKTKFLKWIEKFKIGQIQCIKNKPLIVWTNERTI